VGAGGTDTIDASVTNISVAANTGMVEIVGLNAGNVGALLIADVDTAIKEISTVRSGFGAVQNRLEHRLNNLATYQENLVASESRIRDVDMAAEMVNFSKLQILQQAGTAMLAQANQSSQGVLSLLR
jgi:flagellin